MARWSSTQNNWTPTAVADTTNFTNSGYHALQGGTSSQRINCLEFYLGGGATSSTVNFVVIARDSTVGATGLSGTTFSALDPATSNLAANPVSFSTSTTKPQRSSSAYLLTPTFNAFGGIVRWVAAPGEEIGLLGNTASNGELSISTTSGAGIMSSHIILEPF